MKQNIRFTFTALILAAAQLLATNPALLSGDIALRTTNTISSQHAKSVDNWVGSIAYEVLRGGDVVVRKGTRVTGTIKTAKMARR